MALTAAVRSAAAEQDVGIACSGGLDSGLVAALAKQCARSVTLYTCGTARAFDVVAARDLAERLRLPWVHVPLSNGNVESSIRELIASSGTGDPFTISYELPLFGVCRAAKEPIILSGQGADEYFMGCAKFVGCSDSDYAVLVREGVDRLIRVSVPCERRIANHYSRKMCYPYLDPAVTAAVGALDPTLLRPTDLDSRKAVLKEAAVDLGYPFLAERRKKASQYGSGATDLIRAAARERGMMFNEYIATLYDDVMQNDPHRERGAVINARIDPVVKAEAERLLATQGIAPSAAIEQFYRQIIADGGIRTPKG